MLLFTDDKVPKTLDWELRQVDKTSPCMNMALMFLSWVSLQRGVLVSLLWSGVWQPERLSVCFLGLSDTFFFLVDLMA